MSMRRLAALSGAFLAVAALLTTASASAMPMSGRDWVPGAALHAYRSMAAPYRSSAPAGYVAITDKDGISCIADPAGTGAMGVHWLDPANLMDGQIDPGRPEAFVYAPGGGKLVALEYIVIKSVWDSTHSGPPELFPGHPFMVTEAPNRFLLPDFYSQHVWIGRGNPLGNLSMWNPAVHC